jgi:NAD(P)-dependent dehydrogenase (short-subunit alcohol dehydrogenase family)
LSRAGETGARLAVGGDVAEIVVVTGANGALGRAVVAELLSRAHQVVALDRFSHGVIDLPDADERLHMLPADLSNRAAVGTAWTEIDHIGLPRALVNVAGRFAPGGLPDLTEDDLARQLAVNLSTALWCSQAAAQRLSAGGGGAIVNVGSRSALTGAGSIAYSLSKNAVVRLTTLLAEELKPSRVRVNAVLPDVMDTPANRAALPEEVMRKAVPVEAVAKVIAFLCEEDSWPITGAVIPVYGYA